MAMNNVALKHYRDAVEYLQVAHDVQDVNTAMTCTGMGHLSVELAKFAVDNHALVTEIDEGEPAPKPATIPGIEQHSGSPAPAGGPKVWGTI